MHENHNPYSPPKAFVADQLEEEELQPESLIESGRSVPISRCTLWIRAAFRQFFKRSWKWIGVMLLLLPAVLLISLLPFANLIHAFLWPVVVGGVAHALDTQRRTGSFAVNELLAGFNRAFVPLMMIGAVGLLSYAAMFIVYFFMVSSDAAFAVIGMRKLDTLPPNYWTALLVTMVAIIPVSAATYFAAPLIMLQGLTPVRALKASFVGSMRNLLPLLLFALLMWVIVVLSAIPLLLGLFVTVPTFFMAFYPIYRDIFVKGAGPEIP
jgi:uncharacterized membrane protein